MIKYIKIENCNECPERYHDEHFNIINYHECDRCFRVNDGNERCTKYREIPNIDIIPDWCPLPDLSSNL